MSQANQTRRSTQGTGKDINCRKNRSKQGRQARPARTSAAAVIANSIFALTLSHKGGTEVLVNTSTDKGLIKDVELLYNDLYACLKNALLLLNKEAIAFDPRKFLSMDTSMDWVLREFDKKVKPFGFDFKISEDRGCYCFTIYKECDNSSEWNVFHVCHVLKHLKKRKSSALHDLFLDFLKAFSCITDIDFWFGDTVCYAEEWLNEAIQNELDEGCEDDDYKVYNELVKTRDAYKIGEPHHYEKMIQATKLLSPDTIIENAHALPGKHPIINWIIEGCNFLKANPYSVWSFSDRNLFESIYEYSTGLSYDMQNCIMWNCADEYTARHEEMIDAEAREGVIPPLLFLNIEKDIKSIDIPTLRNMEDFPANLYNFFKYTNEIFEKYEPKHRASNSRL